MPTEKTLELFTKVKSVETLDQWEQFLAKAVRVMTPYYWPGMDFLKTILHRSYSEHIGREFTWAEPVKVWFNPQVPQELRMQILRSPKPKKVWPKNKRSWPGKLVILNCNGVYQAYHESEIGRVRLASASERYLSVDQAVRHLSREDVAFAINREREELNLGKKFGNPHPLLSRPVIQLEVKDDKVFPVQTTGAPEVEATGSGGTETGRNSRDL